MGSLSATVRTEALEYLYPSTGRGLRSTDLRIEPGEIVVTIGPNGSGKSTLVRLLGTELRPHSGRLELFGTSAPGRLNEARRRIGVVGDVSVHVDELSGRQNAMFFAQAYGLGRQVAGERVDAQLEYFGLADHAVEAVATYSFGMRRRLLIATALAHRPDLLVLDEPSVGLDARGQLRLQEAIATRAEDGTAVVAATNLLSGLAETADRVLFLLAGQVVADASPAQLLRDVAGITVIEVAPGREDLVWHDLEGVELRQRAPLLRFESRRGTEPLPSLLRALIDAGVQIDSVAIHEPGLAEAFESLTGQPLCDPRSPGEDSPTEPRA